jgi:hypothetical protein
MRPEDGEKAAVFSDRIAKEIRGLVDYGMNYREQQQRLADGPRPLPPTDRGEDFGGSDR